MDGQPVVEQHQAWPRLDEQIAGMRVPMQDAEMKHLVGIEIIEKPRDLVRGNARLLQGLAVGNLDALDVLHHEEAFGAQFRKRAGMTTSERCANAARKRAIDPASCLKSSSSGSVSFR